MAAPNATTRARSRRYGTSFITRRPERGPVASRRAARRSPVARPGVSPVPRRERASRHTTLKAAIIASMVGTVTRRAVTQASIPPATPPSEAPSAMSPITRRAVWGSKRSFMSDQKPETTVAPKTAMWR